MDKAKATTPTLTTDRASYQRAAAIAGRIVDRVTILPRAVETYAGHPGHAIRLHFGVGLDAGRGVLEAAGIADAEVTRDESTLGVYVECTTTVEGVPLVARALLTPDDADVLLPKMPVTPPVRLGKDALAQVPAVSPIPVVTPVTPVGGAR